MIIPSKPNPATSYAEALEYIEASRQQDRAKNVDENFLPRMMMHGAPNA
jgi:hypothetical protein